MLKVDGSPYCVHPIIHQEKHHPARHFRPGNHFKSFDQLHRHVREAFVRVATREKLMFHADVAQR